MRLKNNKGINKKSQIPIILIVIILMIVLALIIFSYLRASSFVDTITGDIILEMSAKILGQDIIVNIDTANTQKTDLFLIVPLGFLILVIALSILILVLRLKFRWKIFET